MTNTTVSRQKPEEVELASKLAQLQRLEGKLGDHELVLATLQGELHAFHQKFVRVVGILYVELCTLNAQLEESAAETFQCVGATWAAAQARQQADHWRSLLQHQAEGPKDFAPSRVLKSLYRDVAKSVHPDLASEPEDRAKRSKLMAETNLAYKRGDAKHLRKILDEYESSPEAVQGTGVGADLVRVIRKITQVKNRLAEIERGRRALQKSDMAELMAIVKEAESNGRDFLLEEAGRVRKQIRAARHRLKASLG
jgi:hypothetical protein